MPIVILTIYPNIKKLKKLVIVRYFLDSIDYRY